MLKIFMSSDLLGVGEGGGQLADFHESQLRDVLKVGGQGLAPHPAQQPLRLSLHLKQRDYKKENP
jgi:hypothetical protein